MNKQLTTPVIEKLRMLEAGNVQLCANMTLAGVPVTIAGWYDVALNAYNPNEVILAMPMYDEDGDLVNNFDLETFCEMMGWDEYETRSVIQEAVENR